MGKSVYDCMAYMIRMLLDNADSQFYEEFRAIGEKSRLQYNRMLYKEFPELVDSYGNAKMILTPHHIDMELVNRLHEFADNCVKEQNLMPLAMLIHKLDIGLTEVVRNAKTDTVNTQGLNSNFTEQEIQILPRCFCSWAHEHKDKNCSNSLNNFLTHLYFIDTRELKRRTGCEVSHCILSSEHFSRADNHGYLMIGITPLCDETILDVPKIENENGVCEFQITGLSNEKDLIKNVEGILERAKELGVDILCFPEMLGTRPVIGKIRDILSEFPEDEALQYPVLTICPTYWDDGKNISVVLNGTGEVVAKQCKQKAYEYEENGQYYREGIKPDRHIQLIHCDGLGRLGILICRDALEREYLQSMLEILKVTLLVVPSYSTGSYDFSENLKTCAAYDCDVIWINTCAAVPKEKKTPEEYVGFIQKNGKRTSYRNGQYFFEFSKCKKSEEEQACRLCIYTEKLYFQCAGYK